MEHITWNNYACGMTAPSSMLHDRRYFFFLATFFFAVFFVPQAAEDEQQLQHPIDFILIYFLTLLFFAKPASASSH
jgi:hypothetical protein